MSIKIIETHTDIIKTFRNVTTPTLPKEFANLENIIRINLIYDFYLEEKGPYFLSLRSWKLENCHIGRQDFQV